MSLINRQDKRSRVNHNRGFECLILSCRFSPFFSDTFNCLKSLWALLKNIELKLEWKTDGFIWGQMFLLVRYWQLYYFVVGWTSLGVLGTCDLGLVRPSRLQYICSYICQILGLKMSSDKFLFRSMTNLCLRSLRHSRSYESELNLN